VDLKPEDAERASRRRGAELEGAILDAAWDVLTEAGYRGLTYEAVAARAGTSRPVLYRRWPQREELLLAALRARWMAEPVEMPDTGSLRGDALALLRSAGAGRSRFATVMSVQLTEYFRDTGTSLNDLREQLGIRGRPSGMETIVARAVERGELPAAPRSSRVVNLPFDLFRHDMLMTMKPLDEAAIVEIVDEVWLPLLQPAGASTFSKHSDSSEST
jgi:AcrR family transcriptional regulator